GHCRARTGDGGAAEPWRALAAWWAQSGSPPPDGPAVSLEPAPLSFDVRRKELRLQSQPITLVAPGLASPSLETRRGAAADRYGNIYWIDTDRRRLRVWSVGSDRESAFWPDGPMDCATARDGADFVSASAVAPPPQRTFTALAVTEDHYLVAAFAGAADSGLLAFDLMAGGPPVETIWPAAIALVPFDMAQR